MVSLTEREKRALEPPEGLTVSEWAEKYRVLDKRASKEPGPWRNERAPYLRAVMDAFCDHDVEEIILCFAAQSGKTEAIFNMIGYAIDQDPGPAMVVFPTEDICAYVSRNRIQPMIEASPKLKARRTPVAADFQIYEMKFETCTLYLAWSNSPAQLASKPVRYLFMDEVDKFPPFSGKEADPIALAEKRTTSYYGFHKIVLSSTPTVEEGNIWKRLNRCDVIYRYAVPCPHCGEYQFLEFQNLKWEGKTPEDVLENTWYECEYCGGVITELHKPSLLERGRWEKVEEKGKNRRKVGFHLSALYSPFLPWGKIAAEFLEAKDDPSKLMDFVNSRLAEPFKEVVTKRKEEDVLKWKVDLPPGVAPEETRAILGAVDVQENGFYYTIYAFPGLDSYLIRYGFVGTWEELETVFFLSEYAIKGCERKFPVFRVFIDSGARTAEVYEWCRKFYPRVFPVKGASNKMAAPFKESEIERPPGAKGKRWLSTLRLILINTDYYKEEIHRRLEFGGLFLHNETGADFALQLIAEEKRKVRKGNRYVEEWVRVNRANHYLDCTVYALACADHIGVRYLKPLTEVSKKSPPKPSSESGKSFLGDIRKRSGWLERKKGWLK